MTWRDIMQQDEVKRFIRGFDGDSLAYTLYLDMSDMSTIIHTRVDGSSEWLQRDDGSLHAITSYSSGGEFNTDESRSCLYDEISHKIAFLLHDPSEPYSYIHSPDYRGC